MSENLTTTMNGTQSSSCYDPTAGKIGKIFAYCLIFIVSLAGNTVIGIGMIVYKMKTMRKPINHLIVNLAISILLRKPLFFFIFLIGTKRWEGWKPLVKIVKILTFMLPQHLTDPIISLVEQFKQKRRSKADGMKVRFPTVLTRGFLFRLGLALRSALRIANFQIKKDDIKRKPLGPG